MSIAPKNVRHKKTNAKIRTTDSFAEFRWMRALNDDVIHKRLFALAMTSKNRNDETT